MNALKSIAALALSAAALSACSTVGRLENIGRAPDLSPVERPALYAYSGAPVTMPMPRLETPVYNSNSLWAAGARSFFKDQRATKVGDIVTVRIDISDKAKVSNQTSRSRKADEDASLTNVLGLEDSIAGKLLPGGYSPSAALNAGSNTSTAGAGAVDRSEQIALTVAAVVTQVLPNGNLVVEGRQEVRINFEVRDLTVSGVVRPEDVSATNEIKHTQLAEARISYGGRGQITDMQQPRLGQQVVDILFPF
jgi:flagellar L-ring protein precursor FlgH